MADDGFIRLSIPDSVGLGLFLRRGPEATAEVEGQLTEWCAYTTDGGHRSPLTELLGLGGIVAAAVSGVIGGAAWSIFPAAARWLRSRHEKTAASESEVHVAIVECLEDIEPGLGRGVSLADLSVGTNGSWQVILRYRGRTYRILADRSSDIVAVQVEAIGIGDTL